MPVLRAPDDHGDVLSWRGLQFTVSNNLVDVPAEAVADLLGHGFRAASEEEVEAAGATASDDPAAAAEPEPGVPEEQRFGCEDDDVGDDDDDGDDLPDGDTVDARPPGQRRGGFAGARNPLPKEQLGDLTNAGQGPAPPDEPGVPPPQPASPPAHQGTNTVLPNVDQMPRDEMIAWLAGRGETVRSDMRDSTLRERVQAARDKDQADLQRDLARAEGRPTPEEAGPPPFEGEPGPAHAEPAPPFQPPADQAEPVDHPTPRPRRPGREK